MVSTATLFAVSAGSTVCGDWQSIGSASLPVAQGGAVGESEEAVGTSGSGGGVSPVAKSAGALIVSVTVNRKRQTSNDCDFSCIFQRFLISSSHFGSKKAAILGILSQARMVAISSWL